MIIDCDRLTAALERKHEIVFAFLHGSVLTSSNPADIDLAIYIERSVYDRLLSQRGLSFEYVIPLEMEIQRIFNMKVDIQLLNGAPLTFRHRVFSSGRLLIDRDQNLREDIQSMTSVEYFDFKPKRDEYLAEILA